MKKGKITLEFKGLGLFFKRVGLKRRPLWEIALGVVL